MLYLLKYGIKIQRLLEILGKISVPESENQSTYFMQMFFINNSKILYSNLFNLPYINNDSFAMNSFPSCWYRNRRHKCHWS